MLWKIDLGIGIKRNRAVYSISTNSFGVVCVHKSIKHNYLCICVLYRCRWCCSCWNWCCSCNRFLNRFFICLPQKRIACAPLMPFLNCFYQTNSLLCVCYLNWIKQKTLYYMKNGKIKKQKRCLTPTEKNIKENTLGPKKKQTIWMLWR